MTRRSKNPVDIRHQQSAAEIDAKQAARRAELEREHRAKQAQQKIIASNRKPKMTEEEAARILIEYFRKAKGSS